MIVPGSNTLRPPSMLRRTSLHPSRTLGTKRGLSRIFRAMRVGSSAGRGSMAPTRSHLLVDDGAQDRRGVGLRSVLPPEQLDAAFHDAHPRVRLLAQRVDHAANAVEGHRRTHDRRQPVVDQHGTVFDGLPQTLGWRAAPARSVRGPPIAPRASPAGARPHPWCRRTKRARWRRVRRHRLHPVRCRLRTRWPWPSPPASTPGPRRPWPPGAS